MKAGELLPPLIPRRTLADYLPVAIVAGVTVVIFTLSISLAFFAGVRTSLQPCLAGRLDTAMTRGDSLAAILKRGRAR